MDITSKINLPPSFTTPAASPAIASQAAAVMGKGTPKFAASVKDGKAAPKSSSKESTKGAVAPSQSFSVTALTSLFDDSAGRESTKRQIDWGNDLLDQLESLRIQLISGDISREHLSALSELLKTKQGFIVDPELEKIIREIETRVAVELAKLGFA